MEGKHKALRHNKRCTNLTLWPCSEAVHAVGFKFLYVMHQAHNGGGGAKEGQDDCAIEGVAGEGWGVGVRYRESRYSEGGGGDGVAERGGGPVKHVVSPCMEQCIGGGIEAGQGVARTAARRSQRGRNGVNRFCEGIAGEIRTIESSGSPMRGSKLREDFLKKKAE